jgi:hypothetical protein
MASVFLSYDHEDAKRARLIALQLEHAGHSVWWDLHVRGGAQFSKVIEDALKAADVVVVLWSARSVESPWVRDEAGAGRDTARLVPVTLDGIEPPLGFRQFQTIDLSRWRGRGTPPQLQTLLADVSALATGEKPRVATVGRSSGKRLLGGWNPATITAVAAAFAIIVAIYAWSPWSRPSAPAVLVSAGRNDADSRGLAADLAAQLGQLPSVQSGSLRLLAFADADSGRPQLSLEATTLNDAQSSGANLSLKDAADGALVWSQDFELGARSASDMKLQMALTAAQVIGCASPAFGAEGKLLPKGSRSSYLTSCAQGAEGLNQDPQAVVSSLSKVVAEAPRFTPAWRKLVMAESDIIEAEEDVHARVVEQEKLRKDIATAKRLDPHMPEAIIAEMPLVPRGDLTTRMRLIDEAYNANPENPAVLIQRTLSLQAVGRMLNALQTAYEAMGTDQASPAVFDNFVSAAMYSGETELAEQQLKRAESLWPGTHMLDELEWRFYLRFGDPKIALKMAGERTLSPTLMLFAQARANPTKANVDKLFQYYAGRLKGDQTDLPALNILMQAYGQFHREDELYAIMLHWPKESEFDELDDVWFRPALHEFRRDPRFMILIARSPLLGYWRTTGKWPDFCKEPDLPYDCKKEAAKLKP